MFEGERAALTGVSAFVYLQILTACEHFSTAWKQTWKRLLAGVDADVVD